VTHSAKKVQNPLKGNLDNQIQHKYRYVPLFRNLRIRTAIGFFLLVLSVASIGIIFGKGHIEVAVLLTAFAWLPAVFLTDKYVHKYPQRYIPYLIASHTKAAISMSVLLWVMVWLFGFKTVPQDVLWTGFILFSFLDAVASVPRRKDTPDRRSRDVVTALSPNDTVPNAFTDEDCVKMASSLIDKKNMLSKIRCDLDKSFFEFIENNLPDFQGGSGVALLLDDITTAGNQSVPAPVGMLIGRTRINDVLRLNKFMKFCTGRINMGGYFIIRYLPYENFIKNLKARYTGPFYWIAFVLHFIWYRAIPKIPWLEKLYFTPLLSWLDTIHLSIVKKRNRVLSKAEVWGRLSFYGMKVIAESEGDGELYIIAQRISLPVQNIEPSFYLIAALEKVGLDGKIIHTHKIRTMYPFSEFLQRRIFEDYGLAATGKFANDFRLTDYGRFLRKYWLDELPQIFDWLRGDVKLVGMRATSPHFLSLYPKELYDLYMQIKPGLIPPIFDESTAGFDDIIKIELTYLQSYWSHPFRTDIRCLFGTFTDIVFRGVRSK
jgi:lipopolysaccharide/colanic/teichoic acid biosynthesis glycosyltransferase